MKTAIEKEYAIASAVSAKTLAGEARTRAIKSELLANLAFNRVIDNLSNPCVYTVTLCINDFRVLRAQAIHDCRMADWVEKRADGMVCKALQAGAQNG